MSFIFEYGFLIFSLVWIAAFSCFFVIFFFNMLLPALFFGAPYVPSSDERFDIMMDFVQIGSGQKAVDLGAGDGKIVMALAKKGLQAHGYEINPWLVFKANQEIHKAGLQGKAFMHWGNFWNKNLSQFDLITIYGISFAMGRLEKKIKKEAKPGAIIISNYFAFPDWLPVKTKEDVLVYKKQ